MSFLILQYKTIVPVVIDEFEASGTVPELNPFVAEDNIFSSKPNAILNPSSVGEKTFGASETRSELNPTISSESTATGGSSDPNAWWVNNFGEADCVDNEIILVVPTPAFYTPVQQANRYIFLDIGGTC